MMEKKLLNAVPPKPSLCQPMFAFRCAAWLAGYACCSLCKNKDHGKVARFSPPRRISNESASFLHTDRIFPPRPKTCYRVTYVMNICWIKFTKVVCTTYHKTKITARVAVSTESRGGVECIVQTKHNVHVRTARGAKSDVVITHPGMVC